LYALFELSAIDILYFTILGFGLMLARLALYHMSHFASWIFFFNSKETRKLSSFHFEGEKKSLLERIRVIIYLQDENSLLTSVAPHGGELTPRQVKHSCSGKPTPAWLDSPTSQSPLAPPTIVSAWHTPTSCLTKERVQVLRLCQRQGRAAAQGPEQGMGLNEASEVFHFSVGTARGPLAETQSGDQPASYQTLAGLHWEARGHCGSRTMVCTGGWMGRRGRRRHLSLLLLHIFQKLGTVTNKILSKKVNLNTNTPGKSMPLAVFWR
jgi:hypothetical protein